MTKAILNFATGLLLTQTAFGLEPSQLAKDAARFESSVAKNELFINFDKDMVLTRKKDSDLAYLRFEQSLDVKNVDGSQRQVLVKCDLTQETKKNSVSLASTAKEGKWSISKVEKIGFAIQRWTLSRKKQFIDMTCVALEKNGEKTEIATMDSSLIDKALAGNRSAIVAKIQIAADAKSDE